MKKKIAWGILITAGIAYIIYMIDLFIQYPMALLFTLGFLAIGVFITWSLITIINN